MSIVQESWEIYKNEFLESNITISNIKGFLKDIYGIELLKYDIENESKLYSRWKSKLDKKIKDKKNVVYINCYLDDKGTSRPLICGVTKTGKNRTTDFNSNKYANDGKESYKISGRKFLQDNAFDYNKKVIYLFECKDKNEALLLERAIQNKYNLFRS